MLILQALEDSICTALFDVPHPCNPSRLRVNCSSSWHVQVVVLIKREVRSCQTLLRDRLEYVQNIRSLEYCACT
jgi:hypothetical protein